jgi:hypothetical protein
MLLFCECAGESWIFTSMLIVGLFVVPESEYVGMFMSIFRTGRIMSGDS